MWNQCFVGWRNKRPTDHRQISSHDQGNDIVTLSFTRCNVSDDAGGQMLLRPGLGVCYLLLVKENKPKEICCILTAQGLVVEVMPLVSLPP